MPICRPVIFWLIDVTRETSNFNWAFPYSRYETQAWYGGRMEHDGYAPPDSYDNSYHFFSAGGMDFMVVSLECGPVDAMIHWADSIIRTHPDNNQFRRDACFLPILLQRLRRMRWL